MTSDAEPRENGAVDTGEGGPQAWHRAPEPRNLVPLLVEQTGPEYGLVWVLAARSELTPGAVFPARGRRWMVTGLSPSGVTYTCRELGEEPRQS